ncbi:MAG: helix-turn-helix domain-containing protein [Caulobacter sp.]
MSRPEGSPTPRDRATTERGIVEAAAALLAQRGFAALNVQAIAEAAGVDRKLVYRYFGGVEGVVERLGAEVRWTLGEATDARPAGSYGEAAAGLALAYGQALAGDPLMRGLAAWEVVEDTPVLRNLDAARSAAMQGWTATRLAGLERPTGIDVPAINAVLIAGVQMLALRRARQRPFAGVALDDAGWARIEAAVERIGATAYAKSGPTD